MDKLGFWTGIALFFVGLGFQMSNITDPILGNIFIILGILVVLISLGFYVVKWRKQSGSGEAMPSIDVLSFSYPEHTLSLFEKQGGLQYDSDRFVNSTASMTSDVTHRRIFEHDDSEKIAKQPISSMECQFGLVHFKNGQGAGKAHSIGAFIGYYENNENAREKDVEGRWWSNDEPGWSKKEPRILKRAEFEPGETNILALGYKQVNGNVLYGYSFDGHTAKDFERNKLILGRGAYYAKVALSGRFGNDKTYSETYIFKMWIDETGQIKIKREKSFRS